ncbi:serine carboxypeptidase S28-domain-containing protein [Lentinula detonsa]|uniref:Serine carboxypeptidase S28-domain-containing protein n=1 Tax=Lentinula detonsa TaxID=2804962 RepID=A0AA38Q1B6_9AGAR|nr:serine carboxypeptidase S28-domain-containing protein [Lentinula detonsa]
MRFAHLIFPSLYIFALSTCAKRVGLKNHNGMRIPNVPNAEELMQKPVISRNGTQLPPYNTTYYFDQLIDHSDPSKGTFKQRFWHTYEFYEAGMKCVVLIFPSPEYIGYLTNVTFNGLLSQSQNGTTIVLEHRFFGLSNPLPSLTGENLRYLTLQQSIDDIEYFVKNVDLPMPGGDHLDAPWIMVGGSYSGALTSYTMDNKPGLFYAGYASSAPVQAMYDYWGYFEPIRENMPANCSADVEAVIEHITEVFEGGNTTAIQEIKDTFGVGSVQHLDDVAGVRSNLWDWQDMQPTTGPGAAFYNFCDALEVKNGTVASAGGWGLDYALAAWGAYWRSSYLETMCGGEDVGECLDSYDSTATYFTNTTIDNPYRSWNWILCNELSFSQSSPPPGIPALVSRIVQPEYDIRQCYYWYSDVFNAQNAPPMANGAAALSDQRYGGWNVSVDHLFFANGKRDPWREGTVSADGLNIPSTASQPILVSDGFHASDLIVDFGEADPSVGAVQQRALEVFATWLSEWKSI